MKLNEIKDIKKDAKADEPMTPQQERKIVDKVLDRAESELDHDARYKNVEVSTDKKEVEWITQETSPEGSAAAAKILARLIRKAGVKGWKIKVVLRDLYNGDKSTPWKTAKS